ncbi:MAG: MBL fold metallo-hydrolase, partial [Nanoarchaeota archaeon]
RFVVTQQLRATGGLILEMDGEMLHIDPGSGALVRAKENKIDLMKLTGVLVSHCHADHYADLELVVEAMAHCSRKKRGVLLAGENVINGCGNFHPAISTHHLEMTERHAIMKPGDTERIGKIEVKATPMKHGDPKGVGFVFTGTNRIGYAADGPYFKGQESYFQNCDCLILNCLRPRTDDWPTHMNSIGAKELISLTKPKLAVLTHFGMKMLKGVAEKEAAWMQKETCVTTIAAKDRMVLNFADIGALKKFM